MNEKTGLELLDEAEAALRNKKQRQYFSIAGFLFLMAHAFTHVTALLVISIGFFSAAIYRHAQFRAFASRHSKRDEAPLTEPDVNDIEAQPSMSFNSSACMPSIDLQCAGQEYEISFQYEKEDWEGDDILLCKTPTKEAHLHPAAFFNYLKSSNASYLQNLSKAEIENLEQKSCIKFSYLEDSRDYPLFTIEGKDITVMCKYLCPIFHIVKSETGATLIADGLLDESGEDIPTLITKLSADVLENPSAIFSEEDEVWVQI